MFIHSIERVSQFTRPIYTVMRNYGNPQLQPGTSTLFFVNEKGYAVTCKHVVELLVASNNINDHYNRFKAEKAAMKIKDPEDMRLKELEKKYNYQNGTSIQVMHQFFDTVDTMSGFTTHVHPTLDLAILKFNDFKQIRYSDCAKFLKDGNNVRQGKFLCRLGYPFPEFTNFRLNEQNDQMEWTNVGVQGSPRFPIEGMVTRFLMEPQNGMYGIELSTPGLRGQSGGPLFDTNGTIYGMQFSTRHLHLGFDMIDKEILVNNSVQKISDYSFLHLGQCIHVNAIKAFLQQHGVDYYEEEGANSI